MKTYVEKLRNIKGRKRGREAFVSARALLVSSFIPHVLVLVCSSSVFFSYAVFDSIRDGGAGKKRWHLSIIRIPWCAHHLVARSSHCATAHNLSLLFFNNIRGTHGYGLTTRAGVSRGWIGTRYEYKFIVPLNLWFATMVGTGCLRMP